MSRPGELTSRAWWLSPRELENRGLKRCEHCEQLLPVTVSRCRRRQCPGYSETWARDTMRKIRANLRAYGGLVCTCTLTAPGEAMGLVWDRENCTHSDEVKCGREHGRKVLPAAAALWNEKSRGYWRELNRVCKLRADRAVMRFGYDYKGGLLIYEWELQKRGVWHLHLVHGMETAVERLWAFEYVKAMRELGPSKLFGFVDAKPLRSPQPAEKATSYLSKYLAEVERGRLVRGHGDGQGGRPVAAELRQSAANGQERCDGARAASGQDRVGLARRTVPDEVLDGFELLIALCLLEQVAQGVRGP
jgi:hypothetical protein